MPKYIITVHEVWTQKIEIEVNGTQLDAVEKVAEGEGTYLDDTLEYSYTLPSEYWSVNED
jgi:hypothetical protein